MQVAQLMARPISLIAASRTKRGAIALAGLTMALGQMGVISIAEEPPSICSAIPPQTMR